ncbi:MAG: hypothetical protein LC799_09495, partial [Actinobacteria bacterium]|nr:hypothetical protein [Actinomycetota bacterium]
AGGALTVSSPTLVQHSHRVPDVVFVGMMRGTGLISAFASELTVAPSTTDWSQFAVVERRRRYGAFA